MIVAAQMQLKPQLGYRNHQISQSNIARGSSPRRSATDTLEGQEVWWRVLYPETWTSFLRSSPDPKLSDHLHRVNCTVYVHSYTPGLPWTMLADTMM